MPTDADTRLGRTFVPMYRHHRSWLHSILLVSRCLPRNPLSQYILRPRWFIRAILHLHDYRAALEDLHGMPLADRDVQRDAIRTGRQVDDLSHLARVIIKHLAKVPTKAHHRLRTLSMPMYRQRRTRLDGVQHALGTVGSGVVEIVVHP